MVASRLGLGFFVACWAIGCTRTDRAPSRDAQGEPAGAPSETSPRETTSRETTSRETTSRESGSAANARSDASPAAAARSDVAPATTADAEVALEPPAPAGTASPSLAAMCDQFLAHARQEGAEIAKTFSFHQMSAKCVVGQAPARWSPAGAYLDAKTVRVTYVSREETRLAVRLARGWVLTPVAWDVRETESATPMWRTVAPESFAVSAARLVAYLPGADVAQNESMPANATHRLLRGAFACEDDGPQMRCWEWNPTERTPLGTKEAPRGFKGWNERPWMNERALVFGSDAGAGVPPHL